MPVISTTSNLTWEKLKSWFSHPRNTFITTLILSWSYQDCWNLSWTNLLDPMDPLLLHSSHEHLAKPSVQGWQSRLYFYLVPLIFEMILKTQLFWELLLSFQHLSFSLYLIFPSILFMSPPRSFLAPHWWLLVVPGVFPHWSHYNTCQLDCVPVEITWEGSVC